jgi:hypothetical protein
MREESSEPTASENITVTWRRSAASYGLCSDHHGPALAEGLDKVRNCGQDFAPMPRRDQQEERELLAMS